MKRNKARNSVVWSCCIGLTMLALGCRPAGNVESVEDQVPGADWIEVETLPSWADTGAKQRLVDFVNRVTTPGAPGFVSAGDRIAVFDNDGTLWSEQPVYFQLLFAIDRVRALAGEHPEWNELQPFKGAIEGDLGAVAASGEHGILELVMASHAGMTTAEFESVVQEWIVNARHPERGVPYTDLVYQPMLEVLEYLRAHEFKTFIVSGGGLEFMRPWAEEVYGIPPEQVIGSSIDVEYEIRQEGPALVRLPKLDFIDDKAGKPVGIHRFIGRRPLLAFGNSDGDFQMLEWTTAGEGERLGVIIHHTDAEREWAYDRESPIGRLDRGLDEAADRGWLVVDMKNDWKAVHPAGR